MTNAREEAAFLRQRAGIGNNSKGVHLQAVIIMEAQRLMLNHALVEHKAARCQTVARTRVAGIENRHIILLRHLVNRSEQRRKVLLCIDVLLAVRGQ